MRRFPIGPALAIVAFAAVTLVGGIANTVEGEGRLVHDWTDEPVVGWVTHGDRRVDTDEQGRFSLGVVPRDTLLRAFALGYGRVDYRAPREVVRMTPAVLTLFVKDMFTQENVANPEVYRVDGTFIQRGTISGNISFVHPGRAVEIDICAAGYETARMSFLYPSGDVLLRPDPAGGCPEPEPEATPTPEPEEENGEGEATPTPTSAP